MVALCLAQCHHEEPNRSDASAGYPTCGEGQVHIVGTLDHEPIDVPDQVEVFFLTSSESGLRLDVTFPRIGNLRLLVEGSERSLSLSAGINTMSCGDEFSYELIDRSLLVFAVHEIRRGGRECGGPRVDGSVRGCVQLTSLGTGGLDASTPPPMMMDASVDAAPGPNPDAGDASTP